MTDKEEYIAHLQLVLKYFEALGEEKVAKWCRDLLAMVKDDAWVSRHD